MTELMLMLGAIYTEKNQAQVFSSPKHEGGGAGTQHRK